MKTRTKYFGEIEYTEDMLLTFEQGLYAFEDEHSFLLLPFEGDGSLLCLQSLKTPELGFVVMDPFALDGSYAPVLQPEELEALQADTSEDLLYYTLCAVKTPVSRSTVNMRCPVAINPDRQLAMQVILEDNSYEMRKPLSDFEKKPKEEGEPSC